MYEERRRSGLRDIGRRIVAARKAKSMSQEKLAAQSGVERSHMGYTK